MIEYTEAELNEAPKTSNTDNLAVAEDANVDEAVTSEAKTSNNTEIYLKEERKKQAYKETMNIDIEKLTHSKIKTKYIQLKGGKYTKLQNQSFFKKSDIFPDDYIKKYKDDANEAKSKFQDQSERSQHWFDFDFDWIEVNFSTSEPYLYKKKFQSHDDTQHTNTFKFFQVPIGNSKCVEIFNFHNDAPILKYCQKSFISYCFSILAS